MNKTRRILYLTLFLTSLTNLYSQSGSVLTYQQAQTSLNGISYILAEWYAPILLYYTNSPSNTLFISFILTIILTLVIIYFVNKITQGIDKYIFTISLLISVIFIHLIFSSELLFTITTIITAITLALLLIGLELWIRKKTMELYLKLKGAGYYFNNIIQGFRNLLTMDYNTINRLKIDDNQIIEILKNMKHLTRNADYNNVYHILEDVEDDYEEIYDVYSKIIKIFDQMQRTRNPLLLKKMKNEFERLKKLINRNIDYINKNAGKLRLLARINPQLSKNISLVLNDYRNNLKILENSIINKEKLIRDIDNRLRKIKYSQRNRPKINQYGTPFNPRFPPNRSPIIRNIPPNIQNRGLPLNLGSQIGKINVPKINQYRSPIPILTKGPALPNIKNIKPPLNFRLQLKALPKPPKPPK